MPSVATDGNGRLSLGGHPDVALTRLPGGGIVAVPLWKSAARGRTQNQNPHVSPMMVERTGPPTLFADSPACVSDDQISAQA
jgi:hypothetical protein